MKPFSYVLIGLLALSAVSCRSAKTAVKASQASELNLLKDSASAWAQSATKAVWTESVAEDRTSLTLALDSTLAHLPEGASYTAASGRAKVKASVKQNSDGKPPTLIIESSCDSLERLCVLYATENERLSVANNHLQSSVATLSEEKAKRTEAWGGWAAFIAGIMVGTTVTILTRKIWQRQY